MSGNAARLLIGAGLLAFGALTVWGGISGYQAAILAALFTPGELSVAEGGSASSGSSSLWGDVKSGGGDPIVGWAVNHL